MASRYWVLGSGTWDTTTTTNWSATSGGLGGASAPTSVDDVIFDANSNVGTTAFTVTLGTVGNCLSFSTGGAGGALDGVMTFICNNPSVLNIYGSFTLPASNLTWTATTGGVLNFLSTTTGNTFTTNGVFLNITSFNFNGVGGGWTLGSALTGFVNNVIAGTFDTGNYNISGPYFATSGVLAKTVNWGSSTITSTNAATSMVMVSTGLTFNAGTSTLVVSGGGAFAGAGLTFYNVSFTLTTGGAGSNTQITGANTYNNLSFTGRTVVGQTTIYITNTQTVTGTLTVSAPTVLGFSRCVILSQIYGTPVTLTAAAVSLVDVDFRDIAGAGTATWSGTRLGDLGGNTGITFPASKTVYWNLAGTQSLTANGWAATQTGAPATTNFPLAQDIATFTDTNPASGVTISTGMAYYYGTLDFSTRTIPLTVSNNSGINVQGNFTLSSAISWGGGTGITFLGRGGTQTVTSAGTTLSSGAVITQNTIGGTVLFADACVITGAYTLSNGSLSTNYNLTCLTFNSTNTNTRAITFGGNVISLTGTGLVWNFSNITGLTFNAGASTISLTDNSATARSFNSNGLTYWNLQSAGTTGGSALTIIGNNIFNAISSNKTVAHSILFTAGSTTTLNNFLVSGSAGNLVTISSPTAAFHTLVKVGTSNVECNYLNISYSHAT